MSLTTRSTPFLVSSLLSCKARTTLDEQRERKEHRGRETERGHREGGGERERGGGEREPGGGRREKMECM
eukprot:1332598-Amorphochlora_amoeboformis.AAC.1